MARIGKPTKLTPEKSREIVGYVKKGMTNIDACLRAGVSKSSFYEWKKKGEEGGAKNSQYADFLDSLKTAEPEHEEALLNVVRAAAFERQLTIEEETLYDVDGKVLGRKVKKKASPPDWKAAMTLLERRYPEKYGRRDRLQLDQSVEQNVTMTVKDEREILGKLSDDALDALLAAKLEMENGGATLQ